MQQSGLDSYAWLQRIENGILVHYVVPLKVRMKMPVGPMLGGMGEFEQEAEKERVMESWHLTTKTVYCKDLDAVFIVLRTSEAAQAEIAKLKADGKLDSGAFIATA